ncbi:MAG TPA: hypothetical protein PLI19_02095, partial [Erysipelotrichaceae bacterium]|nr:hypothetical protein [Erysipelotrichaceae bacterium]
MTNKKIKNIFIITGVIISLMLLSLYMVFIRGFYASSDKVVGPYTGSASIDEYLKYEEWQIGENQYG